MRNEPFDWKAFVKDKPGVLLAPMAGYTDSPYRRLVKEINSEVLCITELVSADGLHFNSQKTKKMIEFNSIEKPLIVQLFGKHVDFFVKAAVFAIDSGASGIDINMGCPARKVVKSGHGSSLIKTPALAYEIVREVAKAIAPYPVSVKTRLGWECCGGMNGFVKGLVDNGAAAITIHGRTVNQMFTGEAAWKSIFDLKKHIDVPLFGNGDVKDIEDGYEKIKGEDGTVLDGFMIGRATMGNPWIFMPKEDRPVELADKMDVIKKHIRYNVEFFGERHGLIVMRKFLASYIGGFEGVKQMRAKMVRVETEKEACDLLDECLEMIKKERE